MSAVARRGWLAAAALFALFFLLPVAGLGLRALTDGDVASELRSADSWRALRLSLATATLSTLLAAILGTPLAYALARSGRGGARLAAALIDLPIVLPPAAAGIALLTVFGRRGYLGEPLEGIGISLSFTTAAVVLAQLFVAGPYFVRSAYAGFRGADRRFEGVAYTLGLSRWRTFRSVTLPLVRPALTAGAVLCWARALGELGATLLFAGSLPGSTRTAPLAILNAFESSAGLAGAVSISLLLVALALAVMLALSRVTTAGGPYR